GGGGGRPGRCAAAAPGLRFTPAGGKRPAAWRSIRARLCDDRAALPPALHRGAADDHGLERDALVETAHVRGAFAGDVAHATLHDESEALAVLQDAHVVQRIAVD